MTEKEILVERDITLKALRGKLDKYALGGGTALSLVYFQHRESYDLDFFTRTYSDEDIEGLVNDLSSILKRKIKPVSRMQTLNKARVAFYEAGKGLKIDFIEDTFRLYNAEERYNNIPILSKESIYLRKIYATCGVKEILSATGKKAFIGGRQEAKDFFDLYYLSTVYMPISQFARKYCEQPERERIIIWHKRFDRMHMRSGLLDIRTNKEIDVKAMEKHFDVEIEKMIQEEIG